MTEDSPPAAEGEDAVPFGELLVAEGLVPRDQVDLAIQLQATEAQRGVFLRLGELLVAMGHVDEQAVGRILARQGRPILFCPQCLSQYNGRGAVPPEQQRCPRCARPLALPSRLERLSVEEMLGDPEHLGEGGERSFGPYVILGQISRGGMGIVYKVRQPSLDRVVAMKVLSGNSADAEAFLREARAVARLRHPNIVAIHDVGRILGVDYFTMDYVEGVPLNRALVTEALTQREVVELFLKVADAVEYAHRQGVLHRDLKPSNIMFDKTRNPVLIDFGIARLTDGSEESNADQIVGSPAYLPPEYISGDAPYRVAGEVYALGASLYTALAGKPPHGGIDTVSLLRAAQASEPIDLRAIRRSVDRDLATIVMTALQRDPSARYASAGELANDLRRWLEGDEVAGHRGTLGRLWGRHRGRVAAAVGLFISLLLLVGSITTALQVRSLESERDKLEEENARERAALRESLIVTQLELAEARLANGQHAAAEELLNRILQQTEAGPYQGRLFALRAQARAARGDEAGAERDRRSAREASGGS